jgi:hypothetical protein
MSQTDEDKDRRRTARRASPDQVQGAPVPKCFCFPFPFPPKACLLAASYTYCCKAQINAPPHDTSCHV